MTTAELFASAWDWEPSVVAGCAALAAGYLALVRGSAPARTFSFLSGVLLLLLDLVSPVDTLGDQYLFSAHVFQHFLLALVIPALWLMGIPRRIGEAALRQPLISRVERVLARPLAAWPVGVGAMIVWHVPALFNAALASQALHILQHLSFLVTGAIFWWPILHPIEERRLAALGGIAYLFSACVACSLLGALLAIARPGLYPVYLNPVDRFGILALVRDGWGLDPKNDQQLGGMLMWVPGCFVYLSGIMLTAVRWYATSERAAVPEASR
jgi:cytochrome c oxidase assembly factor CtaG